jgi:hypothetical protein
MPAPKAGANKTFAAPPIARKTSQPKYPPMDSNNNPIPNVTKTALAIPVDALYIRLLIYSFLLTLSPLLINYQNIQFRKNEKKIKVFI